MKLIDRKEDLVDGKTYMLVFEKGETKILKLEIRDEEDDEGWTWGYTYKFYGYKNGWGEVKVCEWGDAYMNFELLI